MKTVLIVDADLGFAFWLGHGLDEAGYHAFPARSVADAVALPNELKTAVELLIVDPGIPGAASLVENFRQFNPAMRVVGLRSDRPHAPASLPGVDLWCRKPDRMHPHLRARWIERVQELLPVNLVSRKPTAASLGNLLPFDVLSGWLLDRLPRRSARPDLTVETETPESPGESEIPPDPVPAWIQWEGQILDGFLLERCLGAGTNSAVFLTRYGAEAPRKAAIKLVHADAATHQALLQHWECAATLDHPGVIRIYQTGRCRLNGITLAYVVTEYAEESVAEVLRERPLTTAEVREMLEPVLDALEYVHASGFVHGRLKPANILAAGDSVKISSDGLLAAGAPPAALTPPGIYDPPEAPGAAASPAADVWSLGVTLVEALTLRAPFQDGPRGRRVALPEELPPPFREIALPCLRLNPAERESVAGLAARLRHESPPEPVRLLATHTPFGRWGYAFLVLVAAVALSAVLTRPDTPHAPAPPPAPVLIPAPAPAVQTPPPPPEPRRPVDPVLPEVTAAARSTISGAFPVTVRVDVDASGAVTNAQVESAGPSPYFADRALLAARHWKFTPGPADHWLLRFVYTSRGINPSARPVTP